MEDIYVRKLGFRQHGKACRETDKRAEGCQIKQAQQPEVKALKYRKLAGNGCFRAGDVVHAKKRRKGGQNQQRRPDPRRVRQPHRRAILLGDAVNAEKGKHRQENHQRRNQLHHGHTQVTQPAVNAQRAALSGFREEETDVSHAGSEVGAGKTAQQCNDDKDPVRRGGILDGDPKPDTGYDQDNGA